MEMKKVKPVQTLACVLGLSCLLALSAQARPPAQKFYMYDIGDLGGEVRPRGINASGQIVGIAHTGTRWTAFITGPRGMGMKPIGGQTDAHSDAHAVNASGQVVGERDSRAFITDANGENLREIVMPIGKYDSAIARSVNDLGQVVGTYTVRVDGQYVLHAFVTGRNGMDAREFSVLDRTWAYAINNHGQIGGNTSALDGTAFAFVTGPDAGEPLRMVDETTSSNQLYALNDAGRGGGVAIARNVFPGSDLANPFVADLGQPIRILPNLSGNIGYLFAMNSRGDHVGATNTDTRKQYYRAYVARHDGEPVPLNALVVNKPAGKSLTAAWGINDAQQIVAASSSSRAYIVCPTVACK